MDDAAAEEEGAEEGEGGREGTSRATATEATAHCIRSWCSEVEEEEGWEGIGIIRCLQGMCITNLIVTVISSVCTKTELVIALLESYEATVEYNSMLLYMT